MKHKLPWQSWSFPMILILTVAFLVTSFSGTAAPAMAAEHDDALSDSPLSSAFLDFFGPDGVDECLQPDSLSGYIELLESSSSQQLIQNGNILDGLTLDDLYHFHALGFSLNELIQERATYSLYSQEHAVLTTVWETVGSGRINRKYLNGLSAFCFDEDLKFPNGALYSYVTASGAAITGQAAAIAQRYGASGVDNAQWWNECQVAIWAVQAGCTDRDSAAVFARSYCADRGIRDTDTIADYIHVVGSLVEESRGQSGTAYLYQAVDPTNQRILTYIPVWPDPAPSYPSPRYDTVSASESFTATRTHSIAIQSKYASVTGESLADAVFEVYEDGSLVGTITTDNQGTGSCSWTLTEISTATITKEYCSNYDQLDPTTRKDVIGYTNREDAHAAALAEAQSIAQTQAEQEADSPRIVTVCEITPPTGFSHSDGETTTVTLAGNDSASFPVKNDPWSAILLIDKVDGITGLPIPADTMFELYEWNGSSYECSPHYEMIRQQDGCYTVSSSYPDSQLGHLYYTQANQGRFALRELQAPHGYVREDDFFYFEITEDGQIIWEHNADPGKYPAGSKTLFANMPATGTIEIRKQGDFLTSVTTGSASDADILFTQFHYSAWPLANTVFAVYAAEDILQPGGSDHIASYNGVLLLKDTLVATLSTDTDGMARLNGLPLGSYYVQEIEAGPGDFLLEPSITEITLTYADQDTAVVIDTSSQYHNTVQKVTVSLEKKSHSLQDLLSDPLCPEELRSACGSLSTESLTEEVPLSGAVYGLFAAEDIYGYTQDENLREIAISSEPLIPADTLIERVITDNDGHADFLSHLPCGTYYIRELAAPTGYLLSDEVYFLEAHCTGQSGPSTLSFSHTFYNDPTCVIFTKIDSSNGKSLAGAHLSLHRLLPDGQWSLVSSWISDTAPKLLTSLAPGQYLLIENAAPAGYTQVSPLEFTILDDRLLTSVSLQNQPIPPMDPTPPSSEGAPTGDASPLVFCCCSLISSSLCLFFLRKKS